MRRGINNDAAPKNGNGVKFELEEAEATGVGSSPSAAWLRTPRPVAVAPSANDMALRWPGRSRSEASASRRYHHRARRLTPAEESVIRALAGTRSLRSLAADYGVSHETIRAVCRARS
jgi:hypothetical protein